MARHPARVRVGSSTTIGGTMAGREIPTGPGEAGPGSEAALHDLVSWAAEEARRLGVAVAHLEAAGARAEWERAVAGPLDEEELRHLRAALRRPRFADVEGCRAELARAVAEAEALARLRQRLDAARPRVPEPAPPARAAEPRATARTPPWLAELVDAAIAPRALEDRLVEYLARQVALGRHLADAMEDPYVVNRTTVSDRRRLLESVPLATAWHEAIRSTSPPVARR
jgi:hypothetical protein